MLLFKKKDLLIIISKSGTTVQFTKPLKDILKYQHRYNYKFKLYENGKVTTADDYVINGETLTVLFGSATVTYTSEGTSYTEGGGSESECGLFTVTLTNTQDGFTIDKTHDEIAQLLEAGKRPIAYIDNLGGAAGIVMSNQYIVVEPAIIFTFEYTAKEPGQMGLTYVSRTCALLPNNTVDEEPVTTVKLEASPVLG